MKERPSRALVLRYCLFQVPSAALLALVLYLLHSRFGLALGICSAIFLFWLIKDAVLFPLVWRSYGTGGSSGEDGMAGLSGKSRTAIGPRGKVEVRGEIWHAELAPHSPPVGAGSVIRVLRARGMTLIVEGVSVPPAERSSPPPPRGTP